MSEFKTLYIQDQEFLNTVDEDVRTRCNKVRDNKYKELLEDIKKYERYFKIFDSGENYYSYCGAATGTY